MAVSRPCETLKKHRGCVLTEKTQPRHYIRNVVYENALSYHHLEDMAAVNADDVNSAAKAYAFG